MHRFYSPIAAESEREITLDDPESRHAWTVLRVKVGEEVEVLNGVGLHLFCRVISGDRRAVRLEVIHRAFSTKPRPEIILMQAVLKGKAMDWILQKAAELGVTRVVPVLTERVVVRWNTKETESRRRKWEGICCEALKQCGGGWLPRVELPVRLGHDLPPHDGDSLQLVGSLERDAPPIYQHFERLRNDAGERAPETVALWIGPEGDFTPGELELLRGAGVLPTTFGPRVLRAETAALYAIAVVRYELDR